MEETLQYMAAAALERSSERSALEFDGCWVSWGEMRSISDTILQLLDCSGIRNDAPVALIARNRPRAIAALLALIAGGYNIQMIYGFQSPAGIARDLDRLSPAALVADIDDFTPPVLESLARASMTAIGLDGMAALPIPQFENAPATRSGSKERQIEIFTSGTTGPPKQFAIKQSVIAHHYVLGSNLPFLNDEAAARTDPVLLFFPVGNISGLYTTLPTILRGQPAVLLDRFSIDAWLQHIARYRPKMSGIPPSYYQVLLDADVPGEQLSSLKAMGAGAAPLDPEVQRAFEDKYGIPVLLSYGATEFGGPVTAMSLEDHSKYGRAKLGTVGRPILGAKLRVVDPQTGAARPPGEEGLLEVMSPRIGPDWIHTSDIGMIDADGFVFHRGRADGAIMRGGFKILPEGIEAALKRHPDVSEAVVVGIPDRRLGQAPVAAIRLQPKSSGTDAGVLEAHLRQHVMSTHIPVRWRFYEDFPRTISAKIDRQKIKQDFINDTL